MTASIYSKTYPRPKFYRIFFLLFVLLAVPCLAKAGVSARFQHVSGSSISLEVMVTEPAPNNLIVSIEIPPGARIKTTSPPTRKIEGNGTQAKWLLKRSNQGAYSFSITVDKPVRSGVRGQIQFNDPQSRANRVINISL